MANPNQDLLDSLITRRIFLDRYSERQARGVLKLLREVRDDTIAKIAKLRARDAAPTTLARQKRFLDEVDDLYKSVYGKLAAGMSKEFDELAKQQATWTANQLGSVGAGVTPVSLSSSKALGAYKARPMQGRFMKELIGDIPGLHADRVISQLRISFVEGESMSTAIRRMRDVTKMNSRFLRTFIRTANSHISSVVSDEVYKQNSDLVERYEWLSILDGRTTPVCRGRDGKRYDVGKGPMPPAHPGCRSTTTPILKDFDPPERETFDEWIQRQPAEKQNDILGPRRAKLLRAGTPVGKFVDSSGRTLTLKELGEK